MCGRSGGGDANGHQRCIPGSNADGLPGAKRSGEALWLVLIAFIVVVPDSFAYDIWINMQGRRNAAGEWCCGEGDCFVIPSEQVTMDGAGYILFGAEKIPFTEAQPSPDGAFWRCKRPDGTRRCFFAPPPNT